MNPYLTRAFICSFLLTFISMRAQKENLDKVYTTYQKKLDTVQTTKDKIDILMEAGYFFFVKDQAKSEYFYLRASKLLKGKNNYFAANALSKLGLLSKRKGDFHKSFQYLIEAKEKFEIIQDTSRIGSSYLDLGSLYHYFKEPEKQLQYYRKGYNIVKGINDTLVGKSFVCLGSYFTRANELDSSLFYYEKALNIFDKLELEDRKHQVYNNISVSYAKQGKYEKEIYTRKKTVEYAKKHNNKMLLTVNYHNIGAAYRKLKNYDTALNYIDSSIIIAKNEGFKYRLTKSYKTKSGLHSKLKNYEKAYANAKIHKQYSDSVFNLQAQNSIKELELKNKFEIEKKDLELTAQKQHAESKLYIILCSAIILLAFIFIFFIRKNARIRSKIIEQKLEKEKLKKEILTQKVKTSENEFKSLIADNSMRLEFIKHLSQKIKTDKDSAASKDVKNYTTMLLLKLQQQIDTESKLSLINDKADEINRGFDEKIIKEFPSLTKTEREVCSLLRLNLSIKEIASIRNATPDSVKAARYRIRKKMEIPKSEELEHFIQNLSF